MTQKTKLFGVLVSLALLVGAVNWLLIPQHIGAAPMKALLVDGRTGAPIPGAGVTVSVDVAEHGLWMCGAPCKEIHAYHTTTNQAGYFSIRWWLTGC